LKKSLSNVSYHLWLLLSICLLGSCASIVSKSNWPYYIESEPSGATISIHNKKGREIFKGKTPTAVLLKSGSGFFGKESYTISFIKHGYEEKKINVECKLNGWYFGNILFGGVIGMLIIDPASGAMYRVQGKGTTEALTPKHAQARTLRIRDIHDIPREWHKRLVALK
jgi:hypothetical protein